MTLHKRLSRLEAKTQVGLDAPRVMMFHTCWRDDAGNLQSIAQFAKVQTVAGWEVVYREENETDNTFTLRAEAMASETMANPHQILAQSNDVKTGQPRPQGWIFRGMMKQKNPATI